MRLLWLLDVKIRLMPLFEHAELVMVMIGNTAQTTLFFAENKEGLKWY